MGQRGFTIIEVMLTIAILGVVLALGLPSFRDATANSKLRGATMDLVTTINTARAQAVSLRQDIVVRPLDNNDWGNGWIIEYPAASAEENQEFMPANEIQITETGGLTAVTFASTGILSDTMEFSICDTRAGETGRRLEVSKLAGIDRTELACP